MNVIIREIDIDADTLRVQAEFNGESVLVLVPEAALANRIAVYNLRTPDEALGAILREHAQRLSGLEPQGTNRAERMGGLRADVAVQRARVRVSKAAREVIDRANRG